MQELLNKTLAELKALCREHSCFKGFSFYTKKADLIDFMVNRITILAEVTGLVMPVPVPICEFTVSGFVVGPPPKEPVSFEEDEPEEVDEWVDPDDELILAAASCPHCTGNEIAAIGENQEVWRCNRCHAVGWLPDLADENGHCCPDPGSSKEYENKLRWWRQRARYALEQAAVNTLKSVRPNCPCKNFKDLISGRLHREIQKADLSFSFHFYRELDRQIKAAYPFNSKLTPILAIWNEEGRKILRELGDCVYEDLVRPNLLIRRPKIWVPVAQDGEDDRRGGDPRRSEAEMPEPVNYQSFTFFKRDWENWAAAQEDEAEEEIANLSALDIWHETYPDDEVAGRVDFMLKVREAQNESN